MAELSSSSKAIPSFFRETGTGNFLEEKNFFPSNFGSKGRRASSAKKRSNDLQSCLLASYCLNFCLSLLTPMTLVMRFLRVVIPWTLSFHSRWGSLVIKQMQDGMTEDGSATALNELGIGRRMGLWEAFPVILFKPNISQIQVSSSSDDIISLLRALFSSPPSGEIFFLVMVIDSCLIRACAAF